MILQKLRNCLQIEDNVIRIGLAWQRIGDENY